MAYHIKDQRTDRLIRELAKTKNKSILDSIREACENELRREQTRTPLWERVQPLVRKVADAPRTGQEADRSFSDMLSGSDP